MIIHAFTTKVHKKRGLYDKSMNKLPSSVGVLPYDGCFLHQIIGDVQII